MFTLEIDGKPIAITDADEREANELFGGQDFKDDLLVLESEGRPLWDGSAPLKVRPSSDEEVEAFNDAVDGDDEDEPDDGPEDEHGINVLFVVPVDDMGEEADPDGSAGQSLH